jgi:hypothetical protein
MEPYTITCVYDFILKIVIIDMIGYQDSLRNK